MHIFKYIENVYLHTYSHAVTYARTHTHTRTRTHTHTRTRTHASVHIIHPCIHTHGPVQTVEIINFLFEYFSSK